MNKIADDFTQLIDQKVEKITLLVEINSIKIILFDICLLIYLPDYSKYKSQ
jgi:hypothetical protein